MTVRIRFKVSIVTSTLFIIFAMTLATMITDWWISSRAVETMATQSFEHLSQDALERVDGEMRMPIETAQVMAVLPNLGSARGAPRDQAVLPVMVEALRHNASIASDFFGFADGSFFQVVAVRRNPRILSAYGAPEGTAWIARLLPPIVAAPSTQPTPAKTVRQGSMAFLDESLAALENRTEPDENFDPRERPWYRMAAEDGDPHLSEVYRFATHDQTGMTVSTRLAGQGGVFGIDITLTGLEDFVDQQQVSEHGGVVLFDDQGRILAASRALAAPPLLAALGSIGTPTLKAIADAERQGRRDGPAFITVEGHPLILQLLQWHRGGHAIGIAVAAPMDDFASPVRALAHRILWLAVAGLVIFIPAAMIFSSRISAGIVALANDANHIRQFDFSVPPPAPTRIIEFHELAETFGLMKGTLAHRTRDLEDAQGRLARLIELGIAMSSEQNSNRLMEMILLGAKELTNADGGTLYIMGEDGQLHFQILHNDTLKLALGGTAAAPVSLPPVPLVDADGRPNHRNVVSHAVLLQRTICIDDAYGVSEYDFSGMQAFDRRHGYRSQSFMTVPLKPRGGEILGALQLINARDPETGAVAPFPGHLQRFIEALASQAATALHNRDLLEAQDRLMDAMIQLIAGAIDAKSPYTGGHCARVPELAVMLAEEAAKIDSGPLADFRFHDEKEWREFRIGAWLHDCGKVITPEFVVDKATKLETIYNRIHEIRTRFEVLLRDADIQRLQAVAAGTDPMEADAIFARRKAQLDDDFAFVADCNLGGEFMAPEKLERLAAIAETRWVRHFDDQLGLAHEELKRCAPPAPLPAEEKLLADKPSHRMAHPTQNGDPYAGLGFKTRRPDHLYDLGELHNLSIRRGTLTEEERYKINEHIMQTIAMLERMPFPRALRRVPEYAGTHHETLVGTGYPRQLTKEQLSVPARIMAIADIFEALTASDRPYKKAKTLSESVAILKRFRDDGHIDPDLFDLFLASGVMNRYAERFLSPEQRDEVDLAAMLSL